MKIRKTKQNRVFKFNQEDTLWDDKEEKWYFSVVDVVGIMTESADPKRYWSVLKTRLKKEGAEPTTICSTLKMLAWDGKMRLTDVADQEQMFRLIQSIPSPKAEPFKLWMAQVASERLDEMQEGLLYMLLKNKPHSRFQKLKIMTRAGEWV